MFRNGRPWPPQLRAVAAGLSAALGAMTLGAASGSLDPRAFMIGGGLLTLAGATTAAWPLQKKLADVRFAT